MVHVTDSSALRVALNLIEAHGLVVIKIIFDENTKEADLFVDDVVRWAHSQYRGDWQWIQNGNVVAFIIGKMVTEYDFLLKYLLTNSGRYIADSWYVA